MIRPPYLREVWDYKNANVNHIQSVVSSIDWEFLFHGANVNKKVDILNECLKNIFHNFIPNRIIKCNYRDPPWMTDVIRSKLKERSYLNKTYYKYGERKSDFEKLIVKTNECTEIISAAKDKYNVKMCEKLNDPITAPKTYWNIINRFLSNKIPAIPPLLVNEEIISNFSQKASILNNFFASQCTPLQNSSSLPTFYLRTDETLSTLNISDDDIFAIIKNLNPNKSHGWDNISIRMIKLCGKSIVYPLKLIFEASLQGGGGGFPDYWKKANVVPVHKKESTNLVKSYRPISLLPIFGKIFERVIFKDLFNYFHKNELFTKCQSGFLPGDSCISQLLSIVHDINSSFDCDPMQIVRGMFLDISKAFDKVWQERLLFKLKTYGVKGELLNLLRNYLHKHNQRVVLKGQISSWELIKSGVPKGSVLGPLLFLIYINDLPDNLQSTCKIFADHTFLFFTCFW